MLPRVVLEDELVHLSFSGLRTQWPWTLCGAAYRLKGERSNHKHVGTHVSDAPTCLWCVGRR